MPASQCYCDPEGGTLKNAARFHELHITHQADQLKDSEALYKWACEQSGLATPKKHLKEKKGKGIFRRFFHWIPSKGPGAVDRSRLPKLTAEGTSKLHEFVDIGVAGTVSTRRAACHQCDRCWAGDRRNCENKDFVGPPTELTIRRETVPAAAVRRMDRAALNREGLAMAKAAPVHTVVCVETHEEEQSYPWVIGAVVQGMHDAATASLPHDASTDAIRFERIRTTEPVLKLQLYEPLMHGSTTYVLSDATLLVPARSVRVGNVELLGCRSPAEVRAAQLAKRFKIEEDSLLAIRAAMPTTSDAWEVEAVAQYRYQNCSEQWLIKWKDHGEDRNTWEPWENLLTEEAQAEAEKVKDTALPAMASKLTLPLLRTALEKRGLDASGLKAALVSRLQAALV